METPINKLISVVYLPISNSMHDFEYGRVPVSTIKLHPKHKLLLREDKVLGPYLAINFEGCTAEDFAQIRSSLINLSGVLCDFARLLPFEFSELEDFCKNPYYLLKNEQKQS